jgi:hypothetical protein
VGADDSGGEPSSGEGTVSGLQRELRGGLARLELRVVSLEGLQGELAADLRRVERVTGLEPAGSLAPQARTYQLRTVVTVGASVAAGVVFDKLVALVAHWAGVPFGN